MSFITIFHRVHTDGNMVILVKQMNSAIMSVTFDTEQV